MALTRLLVLALLIDGLVPLMPFIAASHGLTPTQVLLLLGASQMAMAAAQLIAAACLQLAGDGAWRGAALSCVALGLLAMWLAGMGHSPGGGDTMAMTMLLVALHICHGIGCEASRLIAPPFTRLASMGRTLALIAGMAQWQQLLVPLVVAGLLVAMGWRGALLVMAVPVFLVGSWMLWHGHPGQPASPGMAGNTGAVRSPGGADQATGGATPPCLPSWRALLLRPAFYRPTALAAAYQLASAPSLYGLPFLLAAYLDMSPAAIGVSLSMVHALCLAAQVAASWLLMQGAVARAARVGEHLMAGGMIAMLVSGWMTAGDLRWAQGACLLVMLAGGFVMLPCLLEAMKVPAAERTAAAQLFSLVQLAAGASGLLIVGSGLLGFLPGMAMMSAASLLIMTWLRPSVPSKSPA